MVLPATTAVGYIAALTSCLAFGSFCVPMKSETIRAVQMDPLVFQSYKTMVCLLSSLVVVLLGVELTFTPWGVVSGLFWVPAGVAHTTAVQTAGLAISGATGASIVVLVSFVWGIFVFGEGVRSLTSACCAIILMIMGICGMSLFSSPQVDNNKSGTLRGWVKLPSFWPPTAKLYFTKLSAIPEVDSEDESIGSASDKDESLEMEEGSGSLICSISRDSDTSLKKQTKQFSLDTTRRNHDGDVHQQVDDQNDKYNPKKTATGGAHAIVSALTQYVKRTHGISLSIRQMGIIVCAMGHMWGGSVMVPLKLAGEEAQGLGYVFSFAVGAFLVNTLLWVARYYYAYAVHCDGCHETAFQSMPSFHVSAAIVPCSTSGILWSIGNMASMVSVTHLGEGVGYSLCQSSILVAGCWGIFWFKEITNKSSIQGWLASACLAISGILLLSYNHLPPETNEAVLKGRRL